jgi:hypothetical protein
VRSPHTRPYVHRVPRTAGSGSMLHTGIVASACVTEQHRVTLRSAVSQAPRNPPSTFFPPENGSNFRPRLGPVLRTYRSLHIPSSIIHDNQQRQFQFQFQFLQQTPPPSPTNRLRAQLPTSPLSGTPAVRPPVVPSAVCPRLENAASGAGPKRRSPKKGPAELETTAQIPHKNFFFGVRVRPTDLPWIVTHPGRLAYLGKAQVALALRRLAFPFACRVPAPVADFDAATPQQPTPPPVPESPSSTPRGKRPRPPSCYLPRQP